MSAYFLFVTVLGSFTTPSYCNTKQPLVKVGYQQELDQVRVVFPPGATKPIVGVYFTALYRALASSRTRLLYHTQRRATVGRPPLNEWSVRRRDVYLTTLTTDKHPCPGWDQVTVVPARITDRYIN